MPDPLLPGVAEALALAERLRDVPSDLIALLPQPEQALMGRIRALQTREDVTAFRLDEEIDPVALMGRLQPALRQVAAGLGAATAVGPLADQVAALERFSADIPLFQLLRTAVTGRLSQLGALNTIGRDLDGILAEIQGLFRLEAAGHRPRRATRRLRERLRAIESLTEAASSYPFAPIGDALVELAREQAPPLLPRMAVLAAAVAATEGDATDRVRAAFEICVAAGDWPRATWCTEWLFSAAFSVGEPERARQESTRLAHEAAAVGATRATILGRLLESHALGALGQHDAALEAARAAADGGDPVNDPDLSVRAHLRVAECLSSDLSGERLDLARSAVAQLPLAEDAPSALRVAILLAHAKVSAASGDSATALSRLEAARVLTLAVRDPILHDRVIAQSPALLKGGGDLESLLRWLATARRAVPGADRAEVFDGVIDSLEDIVGGEALMGALRAVAPAAE